MLGQGKPCQSSVYELLIAVKCVLKRLYILTRNTFSARYEFVLAVVLQDQASKPNRNTHAQELSVVVCEAAILAHFKSFGKTHCYHNNYK